MRQLLVVFVLAVVSACSSYAPNDRGFGYSDEQIGDGVYRVEARSSNLESAQVMAAVRAAEITQADGSEVFAVLESGEETVTDPRGAGMPMLGRFESLNDLRGRKTGDEDIVAPQSYQMIIDVKGSDEAPNYSADEVIDTFGPKVGYKK